MVSEPPRSPGMSPFQPPSGDPGPQRSRSVLWGVAIGVIACLCLCSGMCVLPLGFGVYQAISQRGKVEQEINGCLQAIASKSPDAAFARFSKRAVEQQLVTRQQIETLADDPHFRDFKSATITNITVTLAANSNPKVPQGTVANVSGTVAYQDDGTGTFHATLEREADTWRLFSLRVNRSNPPLPTAP